MRCLIEVRGQKQDHVVDAQSNIVKDVRVIDDIVGLLRRQDRIDGLGVRVGLFLTRRRLVRTLDGSSYLIADALNGDVVLEQRQHLLNAAQGQIVHITSKGKNARDSPVASRSRHVVFRRLRIRRSKLSNSAQHRSVSRTYGYSEHEWLLR